MVNLEPEPEHRAHVTFDGWLSLDPPTFDVGVG
jgi:hypothetical protein